MKDLVDDRDPDDVPRYDVLHEITDSSSVFSLELDRDGYLYLIRSVANGDAREAVAVIELSEKEHEQVRSFCRYIAEDKKLTEERKLAHGKR